jgi:hypothetical protein
MELRKQMVVLSETYDEDRSNLERLLQQLLARFQTMEEEKNELTDKVNQYHKDCD